MDGSVLEITYRIRCACCGAVEEQAYHLPNLDSSIPRHGLPDGWTSVNTIPFCPLHELKLTDVGAGS